MLKFTFIEKKNQKQRKTVGELEENERIQKRRKLRIFCLIFVMHRVKLVLFLILVSVSLLLFVYRVPIKYKFYWRRLTEQLSMGFIYVVICCAPFMPNFLLLPANAKSKLKEYEGEWFRILCCFFSFSLDSNIWQDTYVTAFLSEVYNGLAVESASRK